nr:DUF6516 family protein [Sporosarcina luteola]
MDLEDIIEKYGKYFESYPNIDNKPAGQDNAIYPQINSSGKNRMDVLFPLQKHPIHGITGIHAIEKYKEGKIIRYHYHWKIISPKMGVQMNHISGWGNDPHNSPGTPDKFIVETEPHHHHHVPGDRSQRKASYDVRTLEDVFEFVIPYFISGNAYHP